MTIEIDFGLRESILLPCMKLFETLLPIEHYGSSFWIQQIQYQGYLSFGSFLQVCVFNLLQAM